MRRGDCVVLELKAFIMDIGDCVVDLLQQDVLVGLLVCSLYVFEQTFPNKTSYTKVTLDFKK